MSIDGVIHKHLLKMQGELTHLLLPLDSRAVHVGMQNGSLCLWEEHAHRPDGPSLARSYAVHGTGHPIPADRTYVGTVADPPFVWHVYELDQGGAS